MLNTPSSGVCKVRVVDVSFSILGVGLPQAEINFLAIKGVLNASTNILLGH